MTEKETDKEPAHMSWIKDLLNNKLLLSWVKKFSADGIQGDSSHARKLGITCSEESISVMDSSAVKMLVTKAEFEGELLNKLSLENLAEIIKCVGTSGNLLITDKKEAPVFIQVNDTVVVLAPKTVDDEEPKKEEVKEAPKEAEKEEKQPQGELSEWEPH